ncbi:hypothetical protein SDC9_77114 [bioreactor metagenome]|uniref:Uncharacterized protein n=1 Tax=bioreactor metagenome TaxID=1076179 RepID=A0A644YX37_9ZZZZ
MLVFKYLLFRLNVLPFNQLMPGIFYQVFYPLSVGFRMKLKSEYILSIDKSLVPASLTLEKFYCTYGDFEGISVPHKCSKLRKQTGRKI